MANSEQHTAGQAPNINHVWARLLIEELVRSGVVFFCCAPGSRSTPLTTAVARHPQAQHVMHVDERGAAFMALGYGRAAGRAAALVTTSGTAVANALPAAVEASVDHVPLLLLTADRPPELRDTGANQTVDQVKLFGDYVRWFFDLPAPTTEIAPGVVLTTAAQAAYRARRPPAGPVHLNCMFREPLAPEADGGDYASYTADLAAWQESGRSYTTYAAPAPAANERAVQALTDALAGVRRGLVVAGRLDAEDEARAALGVARRLGWPLLPDVTSRLRLGSVSEDDDPGIPYYDQLLASEAFAEAHAPEAVLHLGGRALSKRLRLFLKEHRPAPYVVVRRGPERLDPDHHVTRRIEADGAAFARALAAHLPPEKEELTPWQAAWCNASQRAGQVLGAFDAETGALSEPLVARLLSQHIPKDHGLCLASSMPVRDVNCYAAPGGASVPVISNRGASGIDGTVATAAGFARGLGRPVTLLLGDLAALHDLNAFGLLRDVPVVAVVVNNDGGGIFSFLPIAQHADVFEPHFATPHGRSFAHAAALFDLPYARPETPAAFAEVYRAACQRGASALIEVATDRAENRALHERLEARIAAALF